jgi:membrane protein DedA with SNARE-associated domain
VIHGVVDAFQGLSSPWAYVVIAALALLESAAFLGFVVPGETALIFSGFLASQGRLSITILAVVAAAGAIAGDSIGYTLGRVAAGPLKRTRLGRWADGSRFASAEDYLRRRGGIAVFTGRFVGFLRALVPFLAGASRMPYARFLAWNAAGAVVWAPLCIVLGFFAGESYRLIEAQIGRFSLLIGGLVVGALLTLLLWRHVRGAPATG